MDKKRPLEGVFFYLEVLPKAKLQYRKIYG
jgi:hypothetical protein